jgi:hypothetical protein
VLSLALRIIDGMTGVAAKKFTGLTWGRHSPSSHHRHPPMSTAHTCVRSALAQAFRPSNRGTAAPYTVASFLVPALAQHSRRPFSSGPRRRAPNVVPSDDGQIVRAQDTATYIFPPKPTNEQPTSCIPLPPHDARHDIQQWLAAIDPFLPSHLRRNTSNTNGKEPVITSIDLALVVTAAQDATVDILSYLGLVEKRWTTVIWMAKKLIEDGSRSIEPPLQLDPSANIIWPEQVPRTLDDLTGETLRIQRVRPSRKLKLSLDDLTAEPDLINSRHASVKRAVGQLWRSLGSMILASAEQNNGDDEITPHVLEIVAYLHHVGLMPDSVYKYRPHENKYALQQPPTLHMLSSKILTALSDASWKAHEASVKLAKTDAKVAYFLGHEIPGSRYKVKVSDLEPELWLELILWSCLHGGWILDGLAILKQLASKQETYGWGLISWREIMLAEQHNSPSPSRVWKLFPMNGDAAAKAEDRARVRRTISSEIVAAFVDAIVGDVRVGVGFRGSDPEFVIAQLKTLKDFLDANNLSLGSTAWDSIMTRLIESGTFVPEKRPEVLLRLFELAAGFGAEVSTANTSATASDEVPYFFEPTTIPLNLLHRTMRAFIGRGDIKGAMETLSLLQEHTDENKQKSLQQFFELLKSEAPRKFTLFTSHLPPVDFPAFDINMPVHLRAKLLDLATDSKMYDLGRWFLFAQDLDGPLIGRDLYSNRNVAASIVRFGTLAGENDLVLDVIKRVGTWNEKFQQQRMPAEVLTALICSQIKLHRWEPLQSMQRYVTETSKFRPRSVILSTFAAELLRLSSGPQQDCVDAQEAFTGLLFAWEEAIMRDVRNELYCILGIMSTVDDVWKEYCSQFLGVSSRQAVQLSPADFNHVLQGILDHYGSSKGRATVEAWCYMASDTFGSYRAPGGLQRMPRFFADKGAEYDARPKDIELVQESGAKLTLQGRVEPNRQTIWAIISKARDEVDQRRRKGQELSATERAEVRSTLKWAARVLHRLGYEYEDISRDMGSSLTELAELEAPVASLDSAGPDDVGPGFRDAGVESVHA